MNTTEHHTIDSLGYIEEGSYTDRYWDTLDHPAEWEVDIPARTYEVAA